MTEALGSSWVKVASSDDLGQVHKLAERIFPVTYQGILSADLIEYMMELFYKPDALLKQQDAGQCFLILYVEGQPAGYASYSRLSTEEIFKLNKLYLDIHLQGKGFGKFLLSFVIDRIRTQGGRSLRLNVYRGNKAVAFYQKMGFVILYEELLDIGNGHFMDDYVIGIDL